MEDVYKRQVLSYCQNIIALILSKVIGINPLLGLMCGTISMEGGHGSSAAYGATIENLGIQNATVSYTHLFNIFNSIFYDSFWFPKFSTINI